MKNTLRSSFQLFNSYKNGTSDDSFAEFSCILEDIRGRAHKNTRDRIIVSLHCLVSVHRNGTKNYWPLVRTKIKRSCILKRRQDAEGFSACTIRKLRVPPTLYYSLRGQKTVRDISIIACTRF